MKAVLLGATRGMGRSLARRMAEEGASIFLLGRDLEDLEKSAADLESYGAKGTVGFAGCDLLQPEGFGPALEKADAALDGCDTVVVTAGAFGTQEALESDADACARMLQINFSNTVLFCEQVRPRLLQRGGGTLCVFSSVAGERGRKPVILYGAAKAGLTHYLEGMDHRYRSEGLNTICVKPGFVKTSMTAGLKPPPFAGEPDAVAATVFKAIKKGRPVVYAPPIWGLIMFVIRTLPRSIMRRIGF